MKLASRGPRAVKLATSGRTHLKRSSRWQRLRRGRAGVGSISTLSKHGHPYETHGLAHTSKTQNDKRCSPVNSDEAEELIPE